MIVRRGSVVQGGADTFTAGSIDTNLTADGKSGWEIVMFNAYWSNGRAVAAADWEFNAIVSTQVDATTFDQDEEVFRLSWGLQNTGGVAVAVPFEPVKRGELMAPRLTVQPALYVHAASTSTGATNTIYYEIGYNIVKLTDIEVLRLLQAGL